MKGRLERRMLERKFLERLDTEGSYLICRRFKCPLRFEVNGSLMKNEPRDLAMSRFYSTRLQKLLNHVGDLKGRKGMSTLKPFFGWYEVGSNELRPVHIYKVYHHT